MTLENAKRLLEHFNKTNNTSNANKILEKYPELSPKPVKVKEESEEKPKKKKAKK